MSKVQDLMDKEASRIGTIEKRQTVIGSRRYILFFWLSLTFFYAAFTPSTISFMGYMEENLYAAEQITDNLIRLAKGAAPTKVNWTHHGRTEVLLEAPFLLLSRMFFGASRSWNGRVIVLQSILATSLLCAIMLFLDPRPYAQLGLGILADCISGHCNDAVALRLHLDGDDTIAVYTPCRLSRPGT